MLNSNTVQQSDLECGESVPQTIPLRKQAKDGNKPRSFLKEKHQLETVLGPSNTNWFEELTERARLSRKEPFKPQVPLFDSPVSSPTVSQLIKNHIQVGHSPPNFYHSSPAVFGKYIHDESPVGTPDGHSHWQRPSLGISPVLKDGTFNQSRSYAVVNLGLSHDDSTLSWTNSLATPPRLEDPSDESMVEAQTKHKDPVRALFSPSNKLDTTGESIEVLESTYEEDSDESITKYPDGGKYNNGDSSEGPEFVTKYRDEDGVVGNKESVERTENESGKGLKHLQTIEEPQDECLKDIVPTKTAMDSWRDNFRRKLLVKCDSFGKNRSIESSPGIVQCEHGMKSPAKLYLSVDRVKLESCTDGKSVYIDNSGDSSLSVTKSVLKSDKHDSHSSTTPTDRKVKDEGCLSPVFPKPVSSSKKGRRLSDGKRKRESTDSGVMEALSDFFDPPSGAVGKRNTPTLKRKSSELGDVDNKFDSKFIENSFSTPKNEVILNSILMKSNQSRGSSGKKVRFSESVIKHSEEKHNKDSLMKRRKRNKNIQSSNSTVERNPVKKEPASIENDLNRISKFDSDKKVNITEQKSQDFNDDILGNSVKSEPTVLNDAEHEEAFSQVSPTALEEMCDAAKNTRHKNKNNIPQEKCLPGNAGDCNRNIETKFSSPHSNTKPKRFMYPSRKQIVVASPATIFKYKEDERTDAKAKGIVMAIQSNKIVTVKDVDATNKDCKIQDDKIRSVSKKPCTRNTDWDRNVKEEGLKTALHQKCVSSLTNQTKDQSVGFQCASGKGIILSDIAVTKARTLFEEDNQPTAVAKARTLFEEDNQPVAVVEKMAKLHNKDKTNEPAIDRFHSRDRLHQEEMELSEWNDDFEMDKEDTEVDIHSDKHTNSYVVDKQTGGIVQQKEKGLKKQECLLIDKRKKLIPRSLIDEVTEAHDPFIIKKDSHDVEEFAHVKDKTANERTSISRFSELEEASFSNCNMAISNAKQVKQQIVGFTTASGNILNFDEAKLRKAQEFLTIQEETFGADKINVDLFPNESNSNGKITDELQTCKMTEFKQNHQTPLQEQKFSGFATAAGKCLELSISAVNKAKTLLEDSNKENKADDGNMKSKGLTTDISNTRKSAHPLHDLFKEELGLGKTGQLESGGSLNVELEYLKSLKSKTETNHSVTEVTKPKFTKPSPIKRPDNSNKPQGFRPFKAPKRIPLNTVVKYPSSVNTVWEKNKISLTECPVPTLPVTDKDKLKTDRKGSYSNLDDVGIAKSLGTQSNSESKPLLTSNTPELPKTDVCDGIFSQMFADEMEIDDTPCQHVSKLKQHNECINDHSNTVMVEKYVESNQTHFKGFDKETELCLGTSELVPNKLSDIIEDGLNDDKGVVPPICFTDMKYEGFKTASGHSVITSDDAIQRARQSLEEDNSDYYLEISKNVPLKQLQNDSKVKDNLENSGRESMGNKSESEVHVSKTTSFKAISENGSDDQVTSAVLDNGNISVMKANKMPLPRGNMEENISDSSRREHVTPSLSGFCTANRTSVGISQTALKKARETFTDVVDRSEERLQPCVESIPVLHKARTNGGHISNTEAEGANSSFKLATDSEIVDQYHKELKGFVTLCGKDISMSKDGLETTRHNVGAANDICDSNKPLFKGFQTASGGHVSLSGKAIEMAKDRFKDIDNVDSPDQVGKFAIANGSHVTSLDKALELTRNNTYVSNSMIGENKQQLKGFQTASGTHITILDKALEKARESLKDDDRIDDSNKTVSERYQTLEGSHAVVSEQAFDVEKTSLKETESITNIDLPLFKGFQTANGTDVTVSNKALEVARNTLKDTEEVLVMDKHVFKGFQTASGGNVSILDKALEMAKDRLRDSEADGLDKTAFIGFRTASESNIKVCDKALEMARDTLKDTDCSDTLDVAVFKGFEIASGDSVTVSDKALGLARNSLKDTYDMDDADRPLFKGFQTASGNNVSISDTALKMARRAFKETADKDTDTLNEPVFKGFQTASGSHVEVSSKALELARNTLKDTEDMMDKPLFKGFQTASGANVDISNDALKMARDRLKDVDSRTDSDKPFFKEFQTASGSSVKVSDEVLDLARKSLENTETMASMDKPLFIGFQTARGTNVDISEKALDIARDRLRDDDSKIDSDKPLFMGFQTASGTNVQVSNKALEMARNKLTDTEEINILDKPLFKGFQTASGNNVAISDTALEMARNSLSVTEDMDNSTQPVFKGFQTAGGTSVQVSHKALEMARNTLKDTEDSDFVDKPEFKGFQTAGGTSVKVSHKALEMARNTLKDSEDIDFVAKPEFKGFQTAGGSSVQVSHKALEMARNTLKDTEDCDNVDKPEFKGFQTAGGSSVKVSSKALEMARNTLKATEDSDNVDKPEFKGFQTAGGSSVKVSSKALEMARNTLKATEDSDNVDKPEFKGFQTAGGSSVKVSSKALEMARNTLKATEDSDNVDKPEFKGFQTAGGSSVKVSSKALEMARNTLKATEDSDNVDKPEFKGFQTAGGSSVKVSSKALEMARNTLKDAEEINNPIGFETAGGSHVTVSTKALEVARGKLNCKAAAATNLLEDAAGLPVSTNLSGDGEAYGDGDIEAELPDKRQKLGHCTEKGIMHLSALKSDSLLKRKPLRSAPEGITTDRRHPGFRPFKPVCSSNIEKQRKEKPSTLPPASTDTKSSFQTPYKKADISKPTSLPNPVKVDINMKVPVFHSKLKSTVTSTVDRDGVGSDQHVPNLCDRENTLKCDSKTAVSQKNTANTPCEKNVLSSSTKHLNEPLNSLENQLKTKDEMTDNNIKQKPHDTVVVSMDTSDLGSMSQDEDDMFYCNLVEARRRQEEIITSRKSRKIEPAIGRWYQTKMNGDRVKLRDVVTRYNHQIKSKRVFVTSQTAEDYRFSMIDHYGSHTAHVLLGDGAFLVPDDEEMAGKQEFYRAFLTMDGVDPRLVNDVWVYNHYRWIVWKLAAYEVTCPCLYGRSLTPENVMLQLKYRYDREIDRTERSCLKRIYEKDDAASKRLVLCVSSIKINNGASLSESRTSVKQDIMKVDVELTDGWYKVPAQLDGPLTTMVQSGKITVGQKLCISGAEMVGSEDACTPLEAPDSIHLKININSTRLAPWDSMLGYQKDPRSLCVPLVSLYDDGGTVGVIDVVLVRKYPIMYMEKLSGGGCVFRSSRDEEKVQQQYQTKRQIEMEKLYNQIQQEIENEQRQEQKQRRGSKKYTNNEIEQLMTGEEIHEAIENAARPDSVQNYLSDTQQGLLYEYQRCLQDDRQHELNTRVQSTLRDREDEAPTERNVTPLLKFRIAGCSNKDLDSQATTILTVWRPATEITELKEGKRYKIYSLNTSSARSKYIGSSVQVTATKQTKFMHMQIDENLLDRIYEPREVLWVNDIKRRQAPYGEFDFVGYIVRTVSAGMNESVRSPDMIYLADCQSNILCVKFWNGFKIFGEDLFTEGTCVCLSNLMDKSSYRNKSLPTAEATTEFTTVTQKPQNSCQRKALEKLRNVIKSKETFKDDVLTTLEDLLQNKPVSYTPEKYNRSAQSTYSNLSSVKDTNRPTDRMDVKQSDQEDVTEVQPLPVTQTKDSDNSNNSNNDNRNNDNTVNLLDDSLSQTPSSQSRQKSAQSRIAKLAAYGTPDCISPLPVAVPRSVSRGFKPPAFRKKLN